MAYPYRAYDEDEDEDLENMDPAVAAARLAAIEAERLEKAIQISLESFAQEQGEPVQVPEDTAEVPQRAFTAEEIAQDDLRRERELYGSPSPPCRLSAVVSLNPTKEVSTPKLANIIDADDIVRILAGGMSKASMKENAKDSASVSEKKERGMKDKWAAKGASWLANRQKYSLEDNIVIVKWVWILGIIFGPPPYLAASYETAPSIEGLEDAVAAALAAAAGTAKPTETAETVETAETAETAEIAEASDSSIAGVAGSDAGYESSGHGTDMADTGAIHNVESLQGLDEAGSIVEQPVSEFGDQPLSDSESELVGRVSRPENVPSPVAAGFGFEVPHDCNESSRSAQDFDERVARAHAARVAVIEAALNSPDADLEAVALQATHAGRTAREAPLAAPAQATGTQSAPSDPSPRAAGDPSGDDELERFLDESPGNPLPDSEQPQSLRQTSQPEYGKFGFDGCDKPRD